MKKLLLLFAVLLTALRTSAYDFEVDGIYYNVISRQDLTCEVTYKDSNYNSYSGNVTIPSTVTYSGRTFSVTSIGDDAFRYCSCLTSVEIPNSVTSIGEYAFFKCYGLTSVEIPNSVTSIGDLAFGRCSGLTSVVIGNSVTTIGDEAFYRCSGLISVVIGNSVTEIGNSAFYECSSLTSVVIGNSVTTIGEAAFYGCSSLTSLVIPNSVTEIGSEAFYGCEGLTSVVIGNSVTEIGEHAFCFCSDINEITSLNTTPPFVESYTFGEVSKTDCKVMVPEESLAAYQSAEVWKDFWNIVGIDVTGINDVKSGERIGGQAYDLGGQRVGNGHKGIVIRDGKKVMAK